MKKCNNCGDTEKELKYHNIKLLLQKDKTYLCQECINIWLWLIKETQDKEDVIDVVK